MIVEPLEVIDVDDGQRKGRRVAFQEVNCAATMLSSAAIADAGQRIDLLLGEPLQVGAMVANALLGTGDLTDELEGWAQGALDFAAQLVPGGVVGPPSSFPSLAIRPLSFFRRA